MHAVLKAIPLVITYGLLDAGASAGFSGSLSCVKVNLPATAPDPWAVCETIKALMAPAVEVQPSAVPFATESEQLKRQRYLECLSGISSQLLSAPDPYHLLPAIISWLQQSSGASRCYYFDCDRDSKGRWHARQRFEAVGLKVLPLIDDPRHADIIAESAGLQRVIETLTSGNELGGLVAEMPEPERTVALQRGAYWFLILPVIVDEVLVGFIGFDFCEPRADLGAGEVALLRSAANALSAALERVKADTELRDANTLLTSILHSTTEFAIIAADMQLCVLHYNPMAEQLFGYSAEETAGRSLQELELVDGAELGFYEQLLATATSGQQWEQNLELRDPQGRVRQVNLVANALAWQHGDPTGIVIFARDITSQLEDEKRMLEVDRMESIGRLAGGIAHDFNNILMGVLGYASLAKDLVQREEPVFRMLTTIEQSGERAAALTSELLAYARGGKFQSLPLRLDHQADEMLNILGTTLPKNVRIEREYAASLPYVLADPAQMQQVIMNLCINAGEAITERQRNEGMAEYDGLIRLRTGTEVRTAPRNGEIEPVQSSTYVFIEVTDNGCGMEEHTIARIFEPFFTTKFTGRGLGLAAVDGIIRNHNGILEVTTAVSQGTTFKALLPAALDVVIEEVETEELPLLGGLETILVVDDEEVARQMALLTLTNLGYSVLLADNGNEGLSVIRKRHGEIQLVLLDITMPGRSGEALLDEFSIIDSQLPILLTSGYDEATAAQAGLAQRTAGFLQKPYNTESLARAVRAVLDRSAPRH